MAKFTYSQDLNDGLLDFQGNLVLTVKAGSDKASWIDDQTGAKLIVEGRNLSEAGMDTDLLGSGRITEAEMLNGDGKRVISISGMDVKATQLMTAFESGGSASVINFLTSGDDRVIGSRHHELLIGGAGDDVMTGKGGSDDFAFHELDGRAFRGAISSEHDVITDFDAWGDDHDFLSLDRDYEYKATHGGQDTLLTFDDGSTLLLEDVTRNGFKHYLSTIE